jgi:hypothetical protein
MKWAPLERAQAQFAERDARLESALLDSDELVLWFEHDLYDQLQRLQVLARVARVSARTPARRAVISEAVVDGYLGQATAAALRAGFSGRVRIDERTLAQAVQAWLAFAGDDPARLEQLLDEDRPGSPHLGPAIRRWREEFPQVGDGLSRTERQALEALARGVFRARDLHVAACQHAEDAIFIGDSVFASILHRLASGPSPLLSHPDQRPLTLPEPDRDWKVFWNDSLLITRAGRELLAGEGDWMRDAPPRWLGGVELRGSRCWRWDPVANRLRRPDAG